MLHLAIYMWTEVGVISDQIHKTLYFKYGSNRHWINVDIKPISHLLPGEHIYCTSFRPYRWHSNSVTFFHNVYQAKATSQQAMWVISTCTAVVVCLIISLSLSICLRWLATGSCMHYSLVHVALNSAQSHIYIYCQANPTLIAISIPTLFQWEPSTSNQLFHIRKP